jgi:hypothetical protein
LNSRNTFWRQLKDDGAVDDLDDADSSCAKAAAALWDQNQFYSVNDTKRVTWRRSISKFVAALRLDELYVVPLDAD